MTVAAITSTGIVPPPQRHIAGYDNTTFLFAGAAQVFAAASGNDAPLGPSLARFAHATMPREAIPPWSTHLD